MFQRSFVPALVIGLASYADAQFTFQGQTPYPTQALQPDSVAVGDFDQQNGVDFALTTRSQPGTRGPDWVQIFRNLGNGTFAASQALFVGDEAGASAVVAVDFDGDGDLDLAISLANSKSVQIANNDAGTFALTGIIGLSGSEPFNMAGADLDGDDDVDLVTANRATNTLSVLINNGAGGFFTMPYDVGATPGFLALEDFNGDCRTDIAVAAYGDRRVDVLFNLGFGTFGAPMSTAIPGNGRPRGLVATDFDADGAVDLATTVENNNVGLVVVMRNQGSGSFDGTAYLTSGTNPVAIVAGDFDADGDKDLAAVDETSNFVSLLPNMGSATFGASDHFSVGAHPNGLARADFDGNGSLDLVVTNRTTNIASVLLNGQSGGTDNFCVTTRNSVGFGTRIDSKESLSLAVDTFTLLARCAPPHTPGIFFQGTGTANASFGSGLVCVGGQLVRLHVLSTNGEGRASLAVHPIANGVTPGSTRYYQFWHRDTEMSVDLSDGLRATFLP